MRVFVALFSILLIAAALLFMHAGEAQWALKVQRRAASQPWWRFLLSLFSGEVVYIALYGQEVGPDGELVPLPGEAPAARAR
jgi:succinate dehydrogenase hydrophobic anchor subunit